MPALTELLDKPVRDPHGDEFARLHDLVVRVPTAGGAASPAPSEVYPPVVGLVARLKSRSSVRDVFIPWEQVRELTLEGAQLATEAVNLTRFARREGEIVLRDGLFDKQVVDVEGRRVVRINDIDLARQNGEWRLVGVDVGPGGLLRRFSGGRLGQHAAHSPVIDWAQIIPVAADGDETALRLRVPRDRLALLKPAELARVVEQLSPHQGAVLLNEMDEARAADTLEELEDERQGQLLRAMDPERAADVLEEMEPDEAVDALQNVTDEEAADLLGRMNREEADEVQELLGYPEDSAGGIMTTEYVSVPQWATAGEVIAALRTRARLAAAEQADPLPETLSEIFVVAEEQPTPATPMLARLVGVRGRTRPTPPLAPTRKAPLSLASEGPLLGTVTLRDLLLADPDRRLASVMRPVRRVAHLLDNERDVAHGMADDDLLTLPVLDERGYLVGIVTVDDAIDVILPTAWKKRIPRLFQ